MTILLLILKLKWRVGDKMGKERRIGFGNHRQDEESTPYCEYIGTPVNIDVRGVGRFGVLKEVNLKSRIPHVVLSPSVLFEPSGKMSVTNQSIKFLDPFSAVITPLYSDLETFATEYNAQKEIEMKKKETCK